MDPYRCLKGAYSRSVLGDRAAQALQSPYNGEDIQRRLLLRTYQALLVLKGALICSYG